MSKASVHRLRVAVDDGYITTTVECPDEAMGDKRPCAVWEDDMGVGRLNECSFQQYNDAVDLTDWLHGRFEFTVPVKAGGSGYEFHGVILGDAS